ncbi:MAG TPA: hypothetical protein VFZ79_12745 [Acidimicrobiales bacterium]
MAGVGTTAVTRDVEEKPAGDGVDGNGDGTSAPPELARSFLAWGVGSYLVTTLVIVGISWLVTGRELVFVVDDPAIHLSVAENLVHHGTWGVEPGHFQSASSSPLWTLLLAAWIAVVPGPDVLALLALNVAAGAGVVAVFAAVQRVLWPSRSRALDAVAVAVLVNVILFLPGLAMTGMEHTLHMALVLGAVVLFHRTVLGRPVPGPRWMCHVVLALATLARFETAFVAAGIALALLATQPGVSPGGVRWLTWARVRGPALAVAAAVVPLAGFALFNSAMGQGLLPNSVTAKTAVSGEGTASGILTGFLARFGQDALVAALAGVMAVALIMAGRRLASWSFPAIVLIVTVVLHAMLARIGWYERYQAYLIAIGLYAVLCLMAEVLPHASLPPARTFVVPALVAVMLMFSGNKPSGVINAPRNADETYDQRYQAARFLARYYEGEPVATGELGYISLLHDGPITDLFGLGDYEVLQAWNSAGGRPDAEFFADLAERRGFEVVVVYAITLFDEVPEEWIAVGSWDAGRKLTTAPDRRMDLYATTPEAVRPLREHLIEFADELPAGVETEFNELAEFRADELALGEPADGG